MTGACTLQFASFLKLPFIGQSRTSHELENNNNRSMTGDNVEDIPIEPGRGSQKKTYLGKLLSKVVSSLNKVISRFCSVFGIESPIDILHRKIVIAPNTHVDCTPCDFKIPHEDVEIKNNDAVLRGYLLKAPVETKKTVIFFNGQNFNSGANQGQCYKTFVELQKHVPVNVLIVDYRGFGKSSGSPTLNTLVSDAEAMYDYLINKKGLKPEDISVFGASLGGGVAIQLAKRRKINTLVVQSSFTSTQDVAGDVMSGLLPDVLVDALTPLVETPFNSVEAIKEARADNIVILHGTNDEYIPYKQGVSLWRSAKDAGLNPIFIKLKGAGHKNFADFYDDDCFKIFKRKFGVKEENSYYDINSTGLNRILARAA